MLLTRETNLETPQIFIKKWPQGPPGVSRERLLTQFPHPHPSIKDLQKEVIRSATLPKTTLTFSMWSIDTRCCVITRTGSGCNRGCEQLVLARV